MYHYHTENVLETLKEIYPEIPEFDLQQAIEYSVKKKTLSVHQ